MTDVREVRAALLGAAIVGLYLALVLGTGLVNVGDFSQLLSGYLKISFALWVFLGLIVIAIKLGVGAFRSGREAFLADFCRGLLLVRWRRDRCVSLLWPPLLLAFLLASFNAFKQMVLPLAGFRFDPLFTALDRAVFLGADPWRVSHAIFSSERATLMIDSAYHGWFLPMTLGLSICAYLPGATFRLRTQYILTYIGVWVGIGSVLAFLLPAAGPCFYSHFHGTSPSFDELRLRLVEAQTAVGSPFTSLKYQAFLLKTFGNDQLARGGGISAMPSVHNGLAVLFALGAFRLNRLLGYVFSAYAGLIWIGSFHLGWHYAIDGLVAAALTVGLWRVTGRVADALERPLQLGSRQPATA
ncbi:MAG TPA: phosphatase PAP2 family protein [Sphingomicrobium sp.]|jgi:hypothetical protein|nr:phosphatase PAP2 family protein [Sphingomicrobium sp.]